MQSVALKPFVPMIRILASRLICLQGKEKVKPRGILGPLIPMEFRKSESC